MSQNQSNIIAQKNDVSIGYYKHFDMKCSFCENMGLFSTRFFFFLNPKGKKKPRKIFLHRGRKEILCDYQEKKSTPFDSHKYFGNLLDISKFFTFNIRYYNKTSSVVYIRLILKVVGTLPFAVGRSLCRNCPPDPTLNKLFCGARRAKPAERRSPPKPL